MSIDYSVGLKIDGDGPYQTEIRSLLDQMWLTVTGRALLSRFGANRLRTTTIRPLFARVGSRDAIAHTGAEVLGSSADSTPKGERQLNNDGDPLVGTKLGTGAGANAFILFRRADWMVNRGPGSGPDEVLFHELVHAIRFMEGKDLSRRPLGLSVANLKGSYVEPYDNEEEFFAILLSNIYISEKAAGKSVPLVGSHHANLTNPKDRNSVRFDTLASPAVFSQMPLYIALMQKLMSQMPWVTVYIANIDEKKCRFNPLREIS